MTGLPGILLIGLVLAVGVALVVRRARASSPKQSADESELALLRRQKADLARRIAQMDRKAAQSSTANLARRRAEAKQQLVQVILQLKRLEAQSE